MIIMTNAVSPLLCIGHRWVRAGALSLTACERVPVAYACAYACAHVPPVRAGWVRYIYNYYDNFFLNFYE